MKIIHKSIFLCICLSLAVVFANAQTIDWTMKANPLNLSINSVAFRADGQQVLSGTDCHPASIRIFEVASGAMSWDYSVGNNYMCIMGVTFSSNTNYIAAIEEFGNVFLFDNTSTPPALASTINTGTSYGFSTAIAPTNDKVAVGCSNGKLKVYNIPNGTIANDINAHPSWVTTVAYSPNSSFIVTGGNDNKVKIWNTSGTLIATCIGHIGQITNVKVSPDNNFVISTSKDKTIKIWNISNGSLVQTLTGHTDGVNGLDISPDGTKIVSASSDNTCKIWNFATGTLLSTFGSPDSASINTVAWSPNGDKIITGNAFSDVTLWDISAIVASDNSWAVNPITIYPNPAQNTVTIEIPTKMQNAIVHIYNSLGQLQVETTGYLAKNLDISHLSKGIYSLKIQTEEGLFTDRLVVE